MALSMKTSRNMPRTTVMTAVRHTCHAGDNPEWVERPTCKAVVRGSSPLAGSLTRAYARAGSQSGLKSRARGVDTRGMTRPDLMPRVDVQHVGGVPIFSAPLPGPVRAGIAFRTGWADEDLPRRGITHLVEHLALATLDRTSYDFNGAVEATRTTFHCEGTPDQVAGFLGGVTAALRSLPTERLNAEKAVLGVESRTRAASIADVLRVWRFGARRHGMGIYPEFGLEWLPPEAVEDWARQRFTAENAAIWMTCPPPETLSLDLYPDPVAPPPTIDFEPLPLPGLVEAGDGLTISMLVPRDTSGWALEWVLRRRLFDRLRVRDAVSYDVDSDLDRVNADLDELLITTQGVIDRQDDLETGALAVLDDLRENGFTADEIGEWRRRVLTAAAEPVAQLSLLQRMVYDHLDGRAPRPPQDFVDELEDVTPDSVRASLLSGLDSALFAVRSGSTVVASRIPACPLWTPSMVPGRKFVATAPSAIERLVVGREGVGLLLDAERRRSIRWDDCAAVLHWDDGGCEVIGRDGTSIEVAPQDWRNFAEIRTELDRWVPPHALVPLGEAPPRPPAPLPRTPLVGGLSTSMLVVLIVFLAFFTLLASFNLWTFLFIGGPMLTFAGFAVREIYLRRRGRRASGPGEEFAPRMAQRPLRHLPRPALWSVLGISAGVAGSLGLAAVNGANVGPLPVLFGVTAFVALRELVSRG